MSNDLAIAACTATMSRLLRQNINGANVTTLPLDKASQDTGQGRLNLFLYHTAPNAAWRNQPIPDRVRFSRNGHAPLALNLFYLLTAFGDDQGNGAVEETDHQLLGKAMSIFHSMPILHPDQIRAATDPEGGTTLSPSDLHQQIEHVRLTPEPITIDDMMKLWGTFHQSPYRISSAWQASVVLLERPQQERTPFPVFFRGSESDTGPNVRGELGPRLEAVEYRDVTSSEPSLPAARVGDVITILGSNLKVQDAKLVLYDPKASPDSNSTGGLVAKYEPLEGSDDEHFLVRIDSAPSLVAGRLLAVLEYQSGEPPLRRRTNPLQLFLAPRLTADDSDDSIFNGIFSPVGDTFELKLICAPPPGPDRNTSLLLTPKSDGPDLTPIPAAKSRPADPPDEVRFDVSRVPAGSYRVRLRVDMVESLPIRRVRDTLQIDNQQEVQIG